MQRRFSVAFLAGWSNSVARLESLCPSWGSNVEYSTCFSWLKGVGVRSRDTVDLTLEIQHASPFFVKY
jgi:hypothetical protein